MKTELERAEAALAQAKARVERLKARDTKKARKLETRRKVILGARLLIETRQDPELAARVRSWIATMPERDRGVFEGWTP